MSATSIASARLARAEGRLGSERLGKSPEPRAISPDPQPPSSLCVATVRRLSPSERAAEDAARIRARYERLTGAYVPGPGAYDPKRPGSSKEALAGKRPGLLDGSGPSVACTPSSHAVSAPLLSRMR